MTYVRRSPSGEIVIFLRVSYIGKTETEEIFGIKTRLPDEPKNRWDIPINLPIFTKYEDAEKWLNEKYEPY